MKRAFVALVLIGVVLSLGACGGIPKNMEDGILRTYSVSKAAANDFGRTDADGKSLMRPEDVQTFLNNNRDAWEAVLVYYDLKPVPPGWEPKEN